MEFISLSLESQTEDSICPGVTMTLWVERYPTLTKY